MADPIQTPDPEIAAPEEQPADASQGYTIELKVGADGKMSIGVEPSAAEAQEEGAPEDGEGDYKPVGSLMEAIRLIKEIVAHAGNMADMSASQDAMAAGYKVGA